MRASVRPALVTMVLAASAIIAGAPLIASAAPPGYANGPAHPGNSGVFRFNDQVGFFVTDLTSGLTAFHGTSTLVAEFCSGIPLVPDPLTIQFVASPSGGLHMLFAKAEDHVQIYAASPPGCPFWQSLPLLYSGTVRLVRTDNDLTLEGRGADAFGWMATGTLTDHVHGGTVSYRETVRLVVGPHADPNDPNAIREQVITISVH